MSRFILGPEGQGHILGLSDSSPATQSAILKDTLLNFGNCLVSDREPFLYVFPKTFKLIANYPSSLAFPTVIGECKQKAKPIDSISAGVPKLIQTNKDHKIIFIHSLEPPSVEVLAIQYLSEHTVMATCLLIIVVGQGASSEINRIELHIENPDIFRYAIQQVI